MKLSINIDNLIQARLVCKVDIEVTENSLQAQRKAVMSVLAHS